MTSNLAIPAERIERRILLVRGQKVMLDADLAELYGVETKVLNQSVRRNKERFPEDFMFQLTADEGEKLSFHPGASSLRSQIVTSKKKGAEGGATFHSLSPSRAWRCFPACSGASGPSR